tara:strand:+ start:1805 stop:2401 length:597 start_codon:yes stop_codon:yes gene_type:complete
MNVSPHYLQVLVQHFSSIGKVDDAAFNKLVSCIRQDEYAKGEKLIAHGQYAKHLHFIGRGAVIGYITDADGKDYIKSVFFEGDFPSSQVSLLENSPSYLSLETIEDSTIISIDYKLFRELMKEFKSLNDFYISYLEKSWIIGRERREVSLVMESADKRYLDFITRFPEKEKRLKQKHLAAHLGITPTQLSRIKKKLNR